MTELKQDLALAVRRLARAPELAALVIATLAVGIGLTTAVFAMVHAVLLRPLPFPEPGRVVIPLVINEDGSEIGISYPDFLDLQATSRSLAHVGFYFQDELTLRSPEGLEKIPGAWISAGFLPALGVEPLLGRRFTPAEADRPGAPVALLGYGLWQRRFGGDPRVIGRAVEVNQVPLTVVGILPPGYRGLENPEELFVPVPLFERLHPGMRRLGILRHPDFAWGFPLGRLAPGAAPTQALAEVQALERKGRRIDLQDARQFLLGRLGSRLLRLLGAASFVLLIACANAGHLLLTHAAGRHRETALRAALGATRGRLIRHWLLEGLILGAAGAALGLLVARWSLDLLLAVLPLQIPAAIDVRIGGPVLAFAMALSLLGGGLSVLAPALHSAWPDLAGSLRQGGRGATESRASRRTRGLLVATDVALALVLLIGAGLMVRSLERIRSFDPGFLSQRVLSLSFEPPSSATDAERVRLKREVLRRIAELPGVRRAAFTSQVFFDSHRPMMLRVMARHLPPTAMAQTYYVSSGFFRTLGIPLEVGRDFVPSEHRARVRCAIVNRAFAEHYLPGNPLGRRIVLADDPGNPLTVVGVARDVRTDVRPGEPAAFPHVYLPGLGLPSWDFNLVIAAEGDPDALASLARRTIRQISPDIAVFNVARLDARVSDATSETRSFTGLMGVFAGAALGLAVLAIHALVVSMIQREIRDIAVRRVLGAGPGMILRQVLAHGMAPVLLGIVLGLGGAVGLARTLSLVLFEVAPLDPATFLAVPLLFAAAALSASLLAAQRALEIEPVAALREEG